jgi:hypothetical protein
MDGMPVLRVLPVALALAAALPGCFGRSPTPFPPGLEPLDETNQAPPVEPDGADPYPERIRFTMGKTRDYNWVHGRGLVKASVAQVAEALAVPDVVIDRRSVTEWSVTPDVEPGYRVSFGVHNIVRAFVTIEFDVTWREDVVEGTAESPTIIAARWQKTDGSDAITLLRGSLVGRQIADGITEVEVIEHLQAYATGDAGPARTFLEDVHRNVLAHVHGAPLPTYR